VLVFNVAPLAVPQSITADVAVVLPTVTAKLPVVLLAKDATVPVKATLAVPLTTVPFTGRFACTVVAKALFIMTGAAIAILMASIIFLVRIL
jgi:hypothetical protein